MGQVNNTKTFVTGETVTFDKLNNLKDPLVTEFNSNIDNTNIKSNAQIAYSKLTLTDSVINADIKSDAAIAGSKIAPDFGSQAVTSTGEFTGNSFQMPETTAPATAASEGALYTKDTGGQPELFYREESSGDEVQLTAAGVVNGSVANGAVLQVVNTITGAVATGTTVMVNDDSIPQNNEGNEFMTLAITPASTSNKLIIEVIAFASPDASDINIMALFQDSTANALAVTADDATANAQRTTVLTHFMSAGTTSATTFKVRIGQVAAGTFTFNGVSGSRKYGGVIASSITITEVKA